MCLYLLTFTFKNGTTTLQTSEVAYGTKPSYTGSTPTKKATYAILDMQGRVLLRGRVESANFNIAVPNAGNYLVRVGSVTRKVQVK